MNEKDRLVFNKITDIIGELQTSLDANSKSIMYLKDEIHELQPRYEQVIKKLGSLEGKLNNNLRMPSAASIERTLTEMEESMGGD